MTAPLLVAAGTALAGTGAALFLRCQLRRKTRPLPSPDPAPDDPASLTIYTLREGHTYTVTNTFTDSSGQAIEVGQRLTFVRRNFVPYHGGHTLFFTERTIWLGEPDRMDVIAALDQYLRA